jgi:molybdate transport system substrate-binding protein
MLAKFLKSIIFALHLCSSVAAHAGEIIVSAASSLTDAFNEIAASFEKIHPKTTVHFNFAASGALLQQLAKGAPVDVVAFADLETMDRAESQGLVKASDRKIFADNSLVVVTPKNSKLVLKQLQDLTRPEFKRIAIGNPDSVPAGRYAKKALTAASSWDALVPKFIQTQNVRQTLDYVARSEVDAGIVYATDARTLEEKVQIVLNITEQKNAAIKYPIATTAKSKLADESNIFVDYVASDAGQLILRKFGFKKPLAD